MCLSSHKNRKLKVAHLNLLVHDMINLLYYIIKTVMSWSLQKKKEGIFSTAYFFQREIFLNLSFISVYNVLNTLSE